MCRSMSQILLVVRRCNTQLRYVKKGSGYAAPQGHCSRSIYIPWKMNMETKNGGLELF